MRTYCRIQDFNTGSPSGRHFVLLHWLQSKLTRISKFSFFACPGSSCQEIGSDDASHVNLIIFSFLLICYKSCDETDQLFWICPNLVTGICDCSEIPVLSNITYLSGFKFRELMHQTLGWKQITLFQIPFGWLHVVCRQNLTSPASHKFYNVLILVEVAVYGVKIYRTLSGVQSLREIVKLLTFTNTQTIGLSTCGTNKANKLNIVLENN